MVFRDLLKKNVTSAPRFLTATHINQAKLVWIKSIQQAYFVEELKSLQQNQVPHSHVFNRLTAYQDAQGILRVGGRLNQAKLKESTSIQQSFLETHHSRN